MQYIVLDSIYTPGRKGSSRILSDTRLAVMIKSGYWLTNWKFIYKFVAQIDISEAPIRGLWVGSADIFESVYPR